MSPQSTKEDFLIKNLMDKEGWSMRLENIEELLRMGKRKVRELLFGRMEINFKAIMIVTLKMGKEKCTTLVGQSCCKGPGHTIGLKTELTYINL